MTAMAQEQLYIVEPDPRVVQRMMALGNANRIRTHRAEVKRDLKAGRKGMADVLEDEMFETALLFDVLLALPRLGRVKVHKLLRQLGVGPGKQVGELTRRQQKELAGLMGDLSFPREA